MEKRLWSFLAVCLMAVSMAFAQQKVTGVVLEAETGEPIVGASVVVKGLSGVGDATDMNGRFTIQNIPNSAKTLMVSYIGMVTKEVAIKPNLTIYLADDARALNEQIVIAYGTATKETFTGAASVVDAATIESRQISDVTNALAGNVAGVTATKSTGQPGTSSTIRVRGFGSINAGMNPLYVVDGMPYDGDISAINPQDVESLSVLKDAAAASLYGARAANGVILITTKKGARNKDAKISLEASWGANSRQVTREDVITDPGTYYEQLYRTHYNNGIYNRGLTIADARANAATLAAKATGYTIYDTHGGSLFTADGRINPNATLGYSDGEYYYTPDDWQKESFRNGLRQEYNMNVTGGTDKVSYYFSVGYLNDEGTIKQSAFKRISTRSNIEFQAKKWLKLTANLAYTNSASSYPSEQDGNSSTSSGNVFYLANYIAPVYPFYARHADGRYMMDGSNRIYDYGDGTTGNYVRNNLSMANPIGDLTYQTEEYLMDILHTRWGAEITPVKGLTLTARVGLNLDNTRYHYASSTKYGQSASYGGEAIQEGIRTREFTQQYMANYRNRFADVHNIDILAGYESYDWDYEYVEGYGQNLYQSGKWSVNNAIDGRRGYGAANYHTLRSFLARANYDYDEKYFGSLSLRRDGSSRFHPDNRWGTFWSASAAWNLAKESFIADNASWVNLLKLRASFGQQGNENIGNYYAYSDQYTMTGSDGVFSDGTLAYKGNKDLTWEKSNAFDVAVDFNLWNGKLSGSIDYYNRTTQDMLYYKPVASSNGYSSIPANIGSMRNRGIELDLHSQIISTNDLSWSVDFNISHNSNKILELAPDLNGELIDGSRIYQEGKSMYQYYLADYAGVDPTTGLALYWAKDDNGKEYATTDYNDARNTNRKATGNLQAKASGGFGTQLSLYGFDLAIQCSYQFGGKLYDNAYVSLMHSGSSNYAGTAWHKDILKAWTPENTNTNVPRLAADDLYTNSLSNRWLISSNYFAINNITLGYTLPKQLTRRAFLDTVRIYCSADNVALFSARKGMDPRIGVISTGSYYYSAIRTITGGIKINF